MKKDTIKKIIYNTFDNNNIKYNNINEDESLIIQGIVDSMMFVNILLSIEEELNIELDFENINMDSIVSINALAEIITSILNK